jgi:hypothetical protein
MISGFVSFGSIWLFNSNFEVGKGRGVQERGGYIHFCQARGPSFQTGVGQHPTLGNSPSNGRVLI